MSKKKWMDDPELAEQLNGVKERRPHLWAKLVDSELSLTKLEAEEFKQLKLDLMSYVLPSEEEIKKMNKDEYNELTQSVNARFDVVLLLGALLHVEQPHLNIAKGWGAF